MNTEPLDLLLEQLTSGDTVAAEQVFRAYEPYLRMVVHRRLSPEMRSKFDSLDIVQSVSMLVKQIDEGRAEVENQYGRVVRPEGNVKALQAMARTMELRPFFEWRGMGFITQSASMSRSGRSIWPNSGR